jgi:heme exporter protein B
MSLLRQSTLIASKELRIELRSKEILYTMAFFGGLLVVVYSFAFPREPKAILGSMPGMLWVTLAFAGTIGLGRAFDREREHDTMRALLLAPVPRLAVFLGKAFAIAVLVLAVAAIVMPLLSVFMSLPDDRLNPDRSGGLFAHPGPVILAVVLGAIGFAITGTVFAATLLKIRSRDVLLPVILYPLLIPLFVAGTKATAALIGVRADFEAAWYWIQFLGIYDAVFLVVSVWIFESLVIE